MKELNRVQPRDILLLGHSISLGYEPFGRWDLLTADRHREQCWPQSRSAWVEKPHAHKALLWMKCHYLSPFPSVLCMCDFSVLCNLSFLFLKAEERGHPAVWLPRDHTWWYTRTDTHAASVRPSSSLQNVGILALAFSGSRQVESHFLPPPCAAPSFPTPTRAWGGVGDGQGGSQAPRLAPPFWPYRYRVLSSQSIKPWIFGPWSAGNKLYRQGPSGTIFAPKNTLGKSGIIWGNRLIHLSHSYICQMVLESLLCSPWSCGGLGTRVLRAKPGSFLWPRRWVGHEHKAGKTKSGLEITSPTKRWFRQTMTLFIFLPLFWLAS